MNVEDGYYESQKDMGEASPEPTNEATYDTQSNNNVVTDRHLINIEDQESP